MVRKRRRHTTRRDIDDLLPYQGVDPYQYGEGQCYVGVAWDEESQEGYLQLVY
jgi:hypothetical protein